MNTPLKLTSVWCASLLTMILAACGDNSTSAPTPSPTPVAVKYEVEVLNLTYGQPMSPVAAVLQTSGQLWTVGQPASVALERLAEAGDNSGILAIAGLNAKASVTGHLEPGASAKLSLESAETINFLSVVSMPVNTNDAFTGLTGLDLRAMAINSSRTFDVPAYDAGTEGNAESAATIPGPAGGGEGFNSLRDDVNQVRMHSGVVSQLDGLKSSVLTDAHRFDNPMLRIRISRTK